MWRIRLSDRRGLVLVDDSGQQVGRVQGAKQVRFVEAAEHQGAGRKGDQDSGVGA
jgi:hypothetical protein